MGSDELLFLFGYPPGSGDALLRGTLPLRYCTSRFAHKLHTVRSGYDGGLLVRSDPSSPVPGRIIDRSGALRLGRFRVRLRRKNPFMRFFGHLWGIILGREVWKRLKLGVSFVGEDDAGREAAA